MTRKYKKNRVKDFGSYVRLLALSRNRKRRYFFVDKEDYEKVSKVGWCINERNKDYIVGRFDGKVVYIHRFILNAPNGTDCDHINGDRLDNRKENLRLVSRSINLRNKKWKGVSFHKQVKKWRSYITINGKQLNLGLFQTEEEAKESTNKAREKYFPGIYKR